MLEMRRFAPSINTNEQALELIVNAIDKTKTWRDIVICLDVAQMN